jgi:hypothetical protein
MYHDTSTENDRLRVVRKKQMMQPSLIATCFLSCCNLI